MTTSPETKVLNESKKIQFRDYFNSLLGRFVDQQPVSQEVGNDGNEPDLSVLPSLNDILEELAKATDLEEIGHCGIFGWAVPVGEHKVNEKDRVWFGYIDPENMDSATRVVISRNSLGESGETVMSRPAMMLSYHRGSKADDERKWPAGIEVLHFSRKEGTKNIATVKQVYHERQG